MLSGEANIKPRDCQPKADQSSLLCVRVRVCACACTCACTCACACVCVCVGISENMELSFIDLGFLSINKRNGFNNEALTQRSENSAEWID